VNPCTKGLWLWNKVMTGEDKDGKTIHYLIVDTEGIGALDTNSQHDSIIFSLALLLSSNFIYNSVGSIDEGALNNLSLVVNLTKHIHVRSSNAGGGEDDGADFAQYFPSFLWLVRDFTLQLVNSDGVAFSSKEYLERALQPVPGFTEQIEAKNRIRRMLTHFFPERDCFTMVRPVTDESLLQKLSSTPSEQLRPEFVTQMGTLRGTILNSAKTKKMNGTELDGLALINLAYAYTESINTGSVPSIQNAWNYICQSKCQHALTAALKNYENAAKDMLVNLPIGVDELDMTHRKLEAESWKLFEKDAIGDGLEEYKKGLEDKILEMYKGLQKENSARGREKAKEILEKLYVEVDAKVAEDAHETFEDFEADRKRVRAAYMEEVPNGPAKSEVLTGFMETKLAEVGLRFANRFSRELQKAKTEAKAAVEEAQRELSSIKQEAESNLKNLKLKLEFAEKYNEDAKSREKENRDEMNRLRNSHEEAIKEQRAKAETELKSQIDRLEEKRQKAVSEAQQYEQDLLQFKKDQEMQAALKMQELDFAKRTAADSQAREVDLRKLLESAKKDAESEAKALQERFEMESKTTGRSLIDLQEKMGKAAEDISEWEKRHAALGVAMSEQVRKVQQECDAKQAEIKDLMSAKEELEQVGGEKAKAENEVLHKKIEDLQKKCDDVDTAKTALQNQVTVSQEDRARIDSQLQQIKKDLKESEDKAKELANEVDRLTHMGGAAEEKERTKAQQIDHIGKQLTDLTNEKAKQEKQLNDELHSVSDELAALKSESQEQIHTLTENKKSLESQLATTQEELDSLAEKVEQLESEVEATHTGKSGEMEAEATRFKGLLEESNAKHKRKMDEMKAQGERNETETRNGFDVEKEVLNLRIRSLEGQLVDVQQEKDEKQAELDETLKEYETAMDELEHQLKDEINSAEREASAKFAALEKKSAAAEADLTKTNEGLASRNEVIERQLVELKATYKEERAEMETRYQKDMKEYRAEAENRIKALEGDLAATMAKYEMAQADLAKAYEGHNKQMTEERHKASEQSSKLEVERKEMQRLADERIKEMQSEMEDLKSDLKRLENDKIMSSKDHETERALLKSHIDNLEKQLKDRDVLLRDLEGSKESEVSDARGKLQEVKTEYETRMNKEREENKVKYEDLKTKSDEKIRNLKEELNASLTECKVLNEKIENLKSNEQRLNSSLQEYKSRHLEEKDGLSGQMKTVKEQLQQTQKELTDEKSEHQMTKLRSEKQEEWDRRELAQLKDELQDKKKTMDTMISKEIYKRDMDGMKATHQTVIQDGQREREAERSKLEGEKKKLEEDIVKMKADLKKANSEGIMTEAKQKEWKKMTEDSIKFKTDLEQAKSDLDASRRLNKTKEEELKKKDGDLSSYKEQMKPVTAERDEIKRERDELETKVMKMDMEIRNIQQIEERKYQVEIMRLKTEVEELKRESKKKQQIEPKGAMTEASAAEVTAPALTSALARVRARRGTATGVAAGLPAKPS